tara:strand:- start:120 stop:785 length:666 start_codon:yes stop_codon:yes gene_type:complete
MTYPYSAGDILNASDLNLFTTGKVTISDTGEALRMERSGYDSYGYQHSAGSGIEFRNFTDSRIEMLFDGAGGVSVPGSLSKGSGSFRIPHPLPAKSKTHHLVHSFVEGPRADNIYRGQIALTGGAATVDLDAAAGMTTGTFALLNRDLQCFIVNNQGWTAVRGSASGSTLTIEAQDASCTDTIDWIVIGERHDQHMIDTGWTDDNGRVIVEPEVPAPREEA